MSTTIDKKIVEMRFNNADFERKAAQSMRTVDKLKQSLKFDDSGDAIERIAKSVERLEQRFSAFGIIGKRVIENITDSVINLEKRFTGFIINSVRSGGISRAMNLENARFTMQGLLKDEQAVSKVMKAVDASVTGTAYSLDQAATIAAQFVASGKNADEIEGALKGVAGAAAVTNSDFSSMGRIFAQVAGQGRLMGNDLLQLSTRGLNAAATLSDFFNAINKGDESVKNVAEDVQETVKTISAGMEMNEASIRDLVGKGQMSFDIFAAAMNNAFADQASKANDTFTGSLSNIKAALARIGADFVSPLIEQKGPFVNLFNTIREKVNEVKKILTTDKSLGNFLSPAATFVNSASKAIAKLDDKVKNLNFKKIIRPMYNIIFAIQNIKNAISSVIKIGKDSFASIFPKTTVGKTITTITGKIEQLTKKLTPSAETADRLSRIFKGFFSLIKIGVNFVKSFIKVLGPGLSGAFKIGVDSILEFVARIGDAITWVQKWLVESKTFEKTFIIIRDVIGFVVDSIVWIGDKVGAVFDWILSKAVKFKDDLGGGFLHAFGELFKGIGKDIWNLAKGIKNDIVNIWNGVSVTGPLAGIKRFLQGIHDAFAGNPVFDFIVGLFKALKEKIQSVINSFTGIDLSGAGGFMEKLKSKFSWLAVLIDFFKAVGHALKEVGKVVINILKSLGHAITDTLEAVLPGITESLNNIGSGGSFAVGVGAGAGIGAFIYGIVKQLHSIKSAEDVVNTLKKIVGQISGIFGSMQKAIDSFAIKNIAHSIALMAGSLFVLAMIPTERLLKGIVAISALTYALTTAMKAFGQMNKSTSGGDKGGKGKKGPLGFLTSITAGLNTMGVQLIAFASAIAILTGVIGIIGHFSYDTLVKGLTAIIFMIRVISKEAHSLAAAGGAAAATILAFAFAINALILPMIALAAILKLDPTIFLYGGGAIAAIMLSMGLVVDMIGKMTKEASPGALKASALVIVAIGAAMTAITLALAGLMATMVGFEASVGGKNFGVAIDSSPVLRMALGLGIIVSTIAAIAGTVKSLVKTANSIEDPKQVAIVGALFLGIGLVVAAIIKVLGQVTKLGKVGGQFTAIVILKGVNKILSTFSTLFKNIAEIGKASKDARKNIKSMAASALVLSAAVAVIVACMVELAKMRLGDILKTGTTIVAIMGVLVGITVIMGKFQVVQKGILTLSTMLVAISGSAVLFSAAVWMIIEALEELGNQSPRHIDRMLENMGKFLDGLSDMIPKLAWVAGEMVGAFILTIVSAIVNSRAAIFEGIMQLVTTTLAELASNMPAIVNNLVKVVDALVNNIVPQLGHIADQLVILAIGLIKAIAKAIDNHASEIIDAVDRLIGSVAKLAAETIARLLNKQGSELEEFVKKLGPGLKMILKYLVAIKSVGFVSNLLKMGKKDKDGGGIIQTFKNISNTIKTTKGNLALTEGGVRGLGEALQRTGEMSAEAGEKGAGAVGSIAGALGKVLSFLGPHGLIAVGAIAAGAAIGYAFHSYVENMDVTPLETITDRMLDVEEEATKRHKRIMNEASEWQKEWRSEMEDLQKASLKDDIPNVEEYVKKLEEVVTSTGRVKAGMEKEAETLVKNLNPELGNMFELEDGVLTINEKRIQSYKDLESEMDNYVQKLRAETALTRYADKYSEASDTINEKIAKRNEAKKNLELYTDKNLVKRLKNAGINVQKDLTADQIKSSLETAERLIAENKQYTWGGLKARDIETYTKLQNALTKIGYSADLDKAGALFTIFGDDSESIATYFSNMESIVLDHINKAETVQTGYEKLTQEISEANVTLTNYENLSDAVAKGEYDKIDELTTKLEYGLADRTMMTEKELKKQYDISSDAAEDLIELSADTDSRINNAKVEATKERLEIAYKAWAEEARLNGANTETLKAQKAIVDKQIASLDKIKTTSEEAAEATGDWMSKLTMGASTKIGNLKNFDISGAVDALKGKTNISADDLLGMTAGDLNKTMSDYGLDAGDYLITGNTKGIRDNTYKSEEAVDDWIYATNKQYRTGQKIESPSKVYATYGKYLVMGLANGITDNVNLAKNAMMTLASSTLLGLTSVIASQGQVGIKPIVDLSAIQNGNLQRSLNGQNLALNGNVSSQIAASINSVEFEAQIDKLAERLSSMHADMIIIANNNMKGLNQLAKSINGMQVVMDSRALVGQIAAPMDSALGGIAVLKNRG